MKNPFMLLVLICVISAIFGHDKALKMLLPPEKLTLKEWEKGYPEDFNSDKTYSFDSAFVIKGGKKAHIGTLKFELCVNSVCLFSNGYSYVYLHYKTSVNGNKRTYYGKLPGNKNMKVTLKFSPGCNYPYKADIVLDSSHVSALNVNTHINISDPKPEKYGVFHTKL